MALANIRERLQLHYGRLGRLEAGPQDDLFQVRVAFPYRPEAA
jgi:hypothetical protein